MVDHDTHNPRYIPIWGRVDIVVNESRIEQIPDDDFKFFKEREGHDEITDDFSFILDAIVRSGVHKYINVYICDTFVIKDGVVDYFMFNEKAGMVPILNLT